MLWCLGLKPVKSTLQTGWLPQGMLTNGWQRRLGMTQMILTSWRWLTSQTLECGNLISTTRKESAADCPELIPAPIQIGGLPQAIRDSGRLWLTWPTEPTTLLRFLRAGLSKCGRLFYPGLSGLKRRAKMRFQPVRLLLGGDWIQQASPKDQQRILWIHRMTTYEFIRRATKRQDKTSIHCSSTSEATIHSGIKQAFTWLAKWKKLVSQLITR